MSLNGVLFVGFCISVIVGVMAGLISNTHSRKRRPIELGAAGIAGGLLGVLVAIGLGYLLWGNGGYHLPDLVFYPLFWGIPILCPIAGSFALPGIVSRRVSVRVDKPKPEPALATFTQSHSPVIGYTADGRPVTAQPPPISARSDRTNGFAIAALILGLVVAPLAIPFGHIALSQIRRTGEQGNGMAIAGLVLGYLSLALTVATAIVIFGLIRIG